VQLIAWPAVGLGFGADQEQHRADILPRVLGKMAGVVGPAEAGVGLLVTEHTREESLLKNFILFDSPARAAKFAPARLTATVSTTRRAIRFIGTS
jgi:hypothetical protein